MVLFPIKATPNLIFNTPDDVRDYVDLTYVMYYGFVTLLEKMSEGTIGLSDFTSDFYYNIFIHHQGTLAECIEKHDSVFTAKNRRFCFYVTPASPYYEKQNEILLKKAGVDAYMFLTDESYLKNYQIPSDLIIEVTADKDLFTEIFNSSFSNPDDVYGVLDEGSVRATKNFFEAPIPANVDLRSFIAYRMIDGVKTPVGQSMYLVTQNYMEIIGLGTLPAFRRQGIASALLKISYTEAKEKGIPVIMLQTEKDSVNERLYIKQGFTTAFTGTYYL